MCCIEGAVARDGARSVNGDVEQTVSAPHAIRLQHYENDEQLPIWLEINITLFNFGISSPIIGLLIKICQKLFNVYNIEIPWYSLNSESTKFVQCYIKWVNVLGIFVCHAFTLKLFHLAWLSFLTNLLKFYLLNTRTTTNVWSFSWG